MKKELTLEITQKCLNNCIYCSSYSNKDSAHEIQLEKIKSIIDECKELGFTHINLSGGEPFLHKDIFEIVKYINTKGLHIDIYSSGIVLNENGEKSHLKVKILNTIRPYIDNIIFNVQTLDSDKYNKIVNEDHNINLLLKSIQMSVFAGLSTQINFVPMNLNKDELSYIIENLKSLGISKINILKLVEQGRVKDNKDIVLSNKETYNLVEYIKQKQDNNIRLGDSFTSCNCSSCNAGKNKLVIRYDGQVLPCERFKEITNDNNIYNKSLKDMYNKINLKSL
jgi:MoaA/NifB/PqqE/SkfB family radical SAM enzyme